MDAGLNGRDFVRVGSYYLSAIAAHLSVENYLDD